MESSVQNLPCWVLTAISNIIDSEMNARELLMNGASGIMEAVDVQITMSNDVPVKPHLTIVKTGEMK
jgi:hypothetical protein